MHNGRNVRAAAQATYVNNLRTNFSNSFRNRRSITELGFVYENMVNIEGTFILVTFLSVSQVKCGVTDDDFMDFHNFDVPWTNNDEGLTMEENWVNEAILDVAYYLRSHKFAEFDRRFQTDSNAVRNLFAKFPEPPLRSLHWEVSYNCEDGLISCLKYLQRTLVDSKLTRSMDTITLIRKHGWTWENNRNVIENADEECRNIFDMDWTNPEPFQGPLQRFQFRVTASYYMCMFTLQRYPELSTFGEPCDNFASCLINKTYAGNSDPRADYSSPFACAFYSFCPDPCCPVKQLRDVAKRSSCGDLPDNPCIKHLGIDNANPNRDCLLEEESNTDFTALTLNRWNTTCYCCPGNGYQWDSRFASCIDIDECQDRTDGCNRETEICYNLEGSYGCGCARGYWYDGKQRKCVQMNLMKNIPASVNFTPGEEREEILPEQSICTTRLPFLTFLRDIFRKIFFPNIALPFRELEPRTLPPTAVPNEE